MRAASARRTRRKRFSAILATVLAAAAILLFGPASPASASFSCPMGYSCYYSDPHGYNLVFIAPSCGWFWAPNYTRPGFESLMNNGNKGVDVWALSGNVYLMNVPRGQGGSFVPVGWVYVNC